MEEVTDFYHTVAIFVYYNTMNREKETVRVYASLTAPIMHNSMGEVRDYVINPTHFNSPLIPPSVNGASGWFVALLISTLGLIVCMSLSLLV